MDVTQLDLLMFVALLVFSMESIMCLHLAALSLFQSRGKHFSHDVCLRDDDLNSQRDEHGLPHGCSPGGWVRVPMLPSRF